MAEGLIQAERVDRYLWFTAPRILGGEGAAASVGGRGFLLSEEPQLEFESVERLGADLLISARPKAEAR